MKNYSESELKQVVQWKHLRSLIRTLLEKTEEKEEQVGGLIHFLFHVGFSTKTISRILNRQENVVHDTMLDRLSSSTPDIPYLHLKQIRKKLEEGLEKGKLEEGSDKLKTLLQEAGDSFEGKGLSKLNEQVQNFILPVLDTFAAPEKYEKALSETNYLFSRSQNTSEEIISLQDEIDAVLQDRVQASYQTVRQSNRLSADHCHPDAIESIIERTKDRIETNLGISNYYARKRIALVMKPPSFGKRMKELRDGVMTQQEICSYPGSPGRSHLSNIESGDVQPSFGTAKALLDAINDSDISYQPGEQEGRNKQLLEGARAVSKPGKIDELPDTVSFETLSAYLRVFGSTRDVPLEFLEDMFLCNPYFQVENGGTKFSTESLLFLSGMHDRNDNYLLCEAPGDLISLDQDEVERIRTGGYVFSRVISLPERKEDPTPAGLTRICDQFTTEEIRPVVDYLEQSNMVEFDRNNEKEYFHWEELIRVDSSIPFWILDAAGLQSPFISPAMRA